MTTLETDRSDLERLARSVIGEGTRQPFGAYVFLPDDPAAELGRSVERAVFLESFGNTPELLGTEYGPYEASSLFYVVLDHRRLRPAGVIRMIVPTKGGPGLKSLNDIGPIWHEPAESILKRSGIGLTLDRTWDIATLAIDPQYRSAAATGLVALGLYQSIVRTGETLGVEWMVAILTAPSTACPRPGSTSPSSPWRRAARIWDRTTACRSTAASPTGAAGSRWKTRRSTGSSTRASASNRRCGPSISTPRRRSSPRSTTPQRSR